MIDSLGTKPEGRMIKDAVNYLEIAASKKQGRANPNTRTFVDRIQPPKQQMRKDALDYLDQARAKLGYKN